MKTLHELEAIMFRENPVFIKNKWRQAILCGDVTKKRNFETSEVYYVFRKQFWNIKVETTKGGSKFVTIPGMGRCHLNEFNVRTNSNLYFDQVGRHIVTGPVPEWEGDYARIGK